MYKIGELIKTAWRSYDRIPNDIPTEYLPHAERLLNLMNRIAEKWKQRNGGIPPFTCAFRGETLNKKMGGHPNSKHKKACAVDFVVVLKDQDQFMNMLQEHFHDEIDFAQNYIYKIKNDKRIPRNFVHVNIAEQGQAPRKLFNTEIHKGNTILFGSQGASIDLFKE